MAGAARSLATLAAAAALLLAGCADDGDGGTTDDTSASSPAAGTSQPSGSPSCTGDDDDDCQAAPGDGETVDPGRCSTTEPSAIASGLVQGTFGPWCENAVATTYDTALIPDGASVSATVRETEADTTVQLVPQGFAPNTTYTALMHADDCGDDPSDAGEVYQDRNTSGQQGQLSVDFTTDTSGNADASTTVPWLVPDDGEGKSLLISYESSQGGTPAADAGTVVGCITLEE